MKWSDERLAEIRRDVERRLASHVVEPEGDGRWLCRRTDGWSEYWFRVVVGPGLVVLYGDIGELVLLPHDRDALAWLRRTLQDGREIGYPLSKVPADLRRGLEEFSPEIAGEEIAEAVRDESLTADQAEELREALQDDDAQASWDRAWSEISSDCEWPSAVTWTRWALFRLEALRWFVAHLPEQVPGP